MLVHDDSAHGFADALTRLLALTLDPPIIRANAERYSRERFMTEFQAAVDGAIAEREPAP